MKHLFLFLFIVLWLLSIAIPDLRPASLGVSASSPLWTHLSFMFCHASIWHLLFNSIAFFGMFRVVERWVGSLRLSVALVVSSFLLSFFVVYDIPMVGASGCVYYMIGLYISYVIFNRRRLVIEWRQFWLFLVCVAIALSVSYFRPQSAFLFHCINLWAGFISVSIATK
jgi:membrane associated rhomboid family serine protease